MQKGQWSEVTAIASRDLRQAEQAARSLGIAKAYGCYEELLADPQVDAIYNPLPNQLHVPWSIRAAEAGKHVLCEKPLSLTVAEAKKLIAVRDRTKVKIGEAFMVRTHPQWLRVRELVASGRIGELRSATGYFSYFNNDPKNIRNITEYGGGARNGHRMLSHQHFAIYVQGRTHAGAGTGRARPEDEDRPANLSHSRFSLGTFDLHLQHAVGALPAQPVFRNQGAH